MYILSGAFCVHLLFLGDHYRYKQIYQESIPCEQLVMQLCDVKQQYTQFGGERLL